MDNFEELAERLALDVLAAREELGTDQLVQEIADVLEASSSTMHEAFMTAVRVHTAEARARGVLNAKLKAAGKSLPER
ncbi:hypothetical protein SAMN04490248_105168 [Salinihabitans flavidus]|uniref:Uncharacterized protein n=1 Tax=Salinihabitans flavidus TaxID=569882 RepID=A0A1H8PXA9_9RHOB|nr:hypothetical protein [Salinihabitans flavidus]SEO46173.1 hypothetical protein SAMN04490248_105168 [Salinihabitans flavidus]